MTGESSTLRLSTIDDYLGPAERRFFGAGYRRAAHRVVDVLVTPHAGKGPVVTAEATVEYPPDWSRKVDEIDVPPHLSSIDILVLGVQLAEAHLAHGYGLGPDQRRHARLRRVKLIAGPAPQEELTALPARTVLLNTGLLADSPGMHVSAYECRIGVMRVRCEIAHAAPSLADQPVRFGRLEDGLGSVESRYYGTGFTLRPQRLTSVTADTEHHSASASVSVERLSATPEGIEGATQPAFSPIDCFVSSLQLAQVLMYEMDGIRRAESNTLWMLQTSIDLTRPRVGIDPQKPSTVRVDVTGAHLLKLHGKPWRNTEIFSELGGITLRSSLAHELPEKFTPKV